MRRSIVVLSLLLAGTCQPGQAATIYVSPAGNDVRSGGLAEPNGVGTDGPVATLERARDVLREMAAAGLDQPVSIVLRGGDYALSRTLVFTAKDSGAADCPVEIGAYPGERARILGGRAVTGWQRREDGVFVASLADQGFEHFRFHQLFFRGERQILARHPNQEPARPHTGGMLYVDAQSPQKSQGFYYDAGELPLEAWGDASQAEVNIFPYNCWDHNIIPIAEVDTELRHIRLRHPVAGWINEANRYFIQNVLGALDAPGEWYVDYGTGTLYFRPPGGEVADGDVIVPTVESAILLSGTPEAPVRYISIRGLEFAYAEQDAIALEGAEDCEITGNTIRRIGGIGVNVGYLRNALKGVGNRWFRGGLVQNGIHSGDRSLSRSHPCARCRIAGNDIQSAGGDGVALIGDSNVADNNHIYQTGLYDMVCAGVTVYGNENTVSHNDIHNVPRDGIFINGARNTVEYNQIRYSMLYTTDNSAIALRQHNVEQAVKDRGNVIRYNKLLDTIGYGSYPHCTHPPEGFASPFASWGIYLDGSICGVTVYGNVIVRSGANSIFIQFGGGNVVENNILIETAEDVVSYGSMLFFGYFMFADQQARFAEPPNEIKRNILYYTSGDRLLYQEGTWGMAEWNPKQAVFDSNLIFSNGRPIRVEMDTVHKYGSLAEWQATGQDTGTIVADPGFVDAANDDYRLKPGSPAYGIGFVDINDQIARIGAYESDERATWPLENTRIPIEDPVVFKYKKPPKPLVDGFELVPPGAPAAFAQVNTEGDASIQVTDEAKRTGEHSLRFTDAPGLKALYNPHAVYSLRFPDGPMRLSVDLMNSGDAPADWYIELRDWAGPLYVGPTFSGTRDGVLRACGKFGGGGQDLATIPNGTWFSVTLDFATGAAAAKTFTLTLRVDGQADRVFRDLPMVDAAFTHATWLGVSSLSTERAVLYADNLICGPADSEALRDAANAPAIRGGAGRLAPPAIMSNDQQLALYWKFDETDTDDLIDSSGNRLTGDLGGMTRVTGDFGRAVYSDGGGAYASVEDTPLLHFGKGDFAVECWLCPLRLDIDSANKRRRLFDKGLWPATWWNVDIWSDGRVQMEMADSNSAIGATTSNGVLRENEWTHLAIVVDRTARVTRYYLNGVLDCGKPLPADFTGDLNLVGKAFTTGPWQPYTGLIDELKVYTRALSAEEVGASFSGSRDRYASTEFTAEDEW